MRIRWLSQAKYSDGADFKAGSWEPYCPELSPVRFTAVEMTMGMAGDHLLIAGRSHYRRVPRFFAGAQNDEQGHRWILIGSLDLLPIFRKIKKNKFFYFPRSHKSDFFYLYSRRNKFIRQF